MNRYTPIICVIMVFSTYACASSHSDISQVDVSNKATTQETARSVDAVEKHISRPLYLDDKSAVIEYSGTCVSDNHGYPISFPPIQIKPAPENVQGLVAIQTIFGEDKNVVVREAEDGVIVISVGNVWTPILQTKISRLSLANDEQYYPTLAIGAMMDANEMRDAMDKLHAHYLYGSLSFITSISPKGPHLPPLVKDVTAAQFLRLAAKTFKGVVVYAECKQSPGEHLIYVDFAGSVAPSVQ